MSKISNNKTTDRNNKREELDFEAQENLLGFFSLLLKVDRRINPNFYKKQKAGKDKKND